MIFLKEIDFIDFDITNIQNSIKKINYREEDYIFLDFLNKTLDKNDEIIKLLDDDYFILLQEEKYLSFFRNLFSLVGESFVITDIFNRIIINKEIDTFFNVNNILDKKHQYIFVSNLLRAKDKDITNIVNTKSYENLEFFVSLAYRNNSFVDAILFENIKCIFVPNCTYGFVVECKKIDLLNEIAQKNNLYLRKINTI